VNVTKHGASHAAATLTCVVASGLLVRLVAVYLPDVMAQLTVLSRWLIRALGASMAVGTMTRLLFASLLAFIWGIAFKLTLDRD
jgi:hypothetical protein